MRNLVSRYLLLYTTVFAYNTCSTSSRGCRFFFNSSPAAAKSWFTEEGEFRFRLHLYTRIFMYASGKLDSVAVLEKDRILLSVLTEGPGKLYSTQGYCNIQL